MSIKLADRMAALNESATLALNARAKQLAKEGKTIYNLTAGELATDTPDYIQTAVADTLHFNKYTPVPGLPELRRQIAEMAVNFYGLDWIQASNVVVTAGAKPALYATLLALINPGDEVIIPSPSWVSYNELIKLAGGVVVEVPLSHDFDLDADAIAAKISKRTKAIIINSPQNPTGAIFSKVALERLADALVGSQVTVIADDIYVKLIYDDSFTIVPTCGFEKLVIINGFSKSQALTGWRIGYVIAEQKLAAGISSILSHITGNASVPAQHAALAALSRNDKPPAETLADLKKNRDIVDKALDGMSQLSHNSPRGAFYAFIDIRGITLDSLHWCEALLNETGVALVPGEAFGTPGFARLSFAADEKTITKALELIKQFAANGVKQ